MLTIEALNKLSLELREFPITSHEMPFLKAIYKLGKVAGAKGMQALEPMSEDEIKAILINIDPMTARVPKGMLSLVRAIEARRIGVKK